MIKFSILLFSILSNISAHASAPVEQCLGLNMGGQIFQTFSIEVNKAGNGHSMSIHTTSGTIENYPENVVDVKKYFKQDISEILESYAISASWKSQAASGVVFTAMPSEDGAACQLVVALDKNGKTLGRIAMQGWLGGLCLN